MCLPARACACVRPIKCDVGQYGHTATPACTQEERAALEANVTAQLEAEKAALLQKKRAEQAARKRAQDELERILADNQHKLELAQRKAHDDGGSWAGRDDAVPRTLNGGIRVSVDD